MTLGVLGTPLKPNIALSKVMVGILFPLEMPPFWGGIRIFSGGVYTFFLSCDSYTLRTCLGRVGYQKPMISDAMSVKVMVVISMGFFR